EDRQPRNGAERKGDAQRHRSGEGTVCHHWFPSVTAARASRLTPCTRDAVLAGAFGLVAELPCSLSEAACDSRLIGSWMISGPVVVPHLILAVPTFSRRCKHLQANGRPLRLRA